MLGADLSAFGFEAADFLLQITRPRQFRTAFLLLKNSNQITMTDVTGPQGNAPGPTMSKTKLKQTIWPEPLIINPTITHTHSIVLLHGRGSNAERFGLELLAARSSGGKTLTEHFPSTKFIFPTAKKRRSTVLKRIPINQWFDNFSLEDPSQRQNLQYEGLRETSAFVAGLLHSEAKIVGADRIVVGGLSQGCAAALHVLLNFEGSFPLAGFVGMSGWLPFAEILDPAVEDGNENEDDIFDPYRADKDSSRQDAGSHRRPSLHELQRTAVDVARDIASLTPLSPSQEVLFPGTPIFLGHGRNDEKVSANLGDQARSVLQALGCNVTWKDYDEGHWYKVPEEIDDIVYFLQNTVKI